MIFQEQTPDFKTFAKTIEDYLLSIKSAKKMFREQQMILI